MWAISTRLKGSIRRTRFCSSSVPVHHKHKSRRDQAVSNIRYQGGMQLWQMSGPVLLLWYSNLAAADLRFGTAWAVSRRLEKDAAATSQLSAHHRGQ